MNRNTISNKPKYTLGTIVKYFVLIQFALTCIIHFGWVAVSSLKTDQEIYGNSFGLPEKLMWSNYAEAAKGANIGTGLLNSLFYSTASVVLLMLISAMAAYVIARVLPKRGLYNFYTLGIMIPIHAVIIPLLIILRFAGLVNTRLGVILTYTASEISFSVFILVSFMKGLPKEIEEAARLDGCSRTRTFFSIVLPLCKPGLATVATFAFVNIWNDLLISMVLIPTPKLQTLNLSCFNLRGQYVQHYGLICAGLMLVIIPVVIVYFIFQEQLVKGLTAGAVKS